MIPRGAIECSALLVLALQLPLSAGAAGPQNLVANGDFSQVTDGKPDNWETAGDSKSVTQTLRAAKDADGKPFAQLVCTRCDRQNPSSHAMLAQIGLVKLVKGRAYEFSCRMWAQGLASRAVSVGISETKNWTNAGLSENLSAGAAWKTYRRIFSANQDLGPTGRLQIWFNEPGTLDVADVRIVEVSQADVELTDLVPPVGGKNLLPNGSFEVGAEHWSSLGAGAGWGNLDRLHGKIEGTGGTHGRSFLRIALGGDQTPVLYFDYYEPVVRRELRPLAASVGWIKVEKGAAYTLSCDMRASAEDTPAVLGVRAKDPAGPSRDAKLSVKLSKAWKRYSLTFRPEYRFLFVFAGPDLAQEQRVDVDIDAVQLEKAEKGTDFQPRSDVEFALEPSQPGGIFVEGEPAALVLRACNHGASSARATVKFQVTDFEDRPVPWPEESLEVAAGSAVQRERKIPSDWKGYYRVRASAEAGGKADLADVRLAIVPRRTAGDSVCGINHAFAPGSLIDLASKAGVTWYRDWSLKLQHVEPSRGQFRWEVPDVQIDRVLQRGVRVLPLLPPFPSADWCSEAPANLPTTGYPGVRIRQAWAPKDANDLAAFIAQAVGRYKDRIGVWDFLNEPIYTDYALPADHAGKYGGKRYGPADYVALLEVAAASMRKADPNCKVIGGIGSGPRHLTREVIEAGCLKHADIFNLHMYPGTRAPETYAAEMDELLALMDAHGGRKPVWITEFSYYGADDLPRRPFFPAGGWAEQRLLENERQCADYTLRFFAVMLSRGAQKVFIHSGASGRVNDPEFECALFDYGGRPRKLLPALAVFTELLGASPACAGFRRLGESGHCVAFETGKQSVLVLWQEEDAPAGGAIEAPSGADLRRLDAMGRAVSSQPAKLSTSPMYFVGPAGRAKELLPAIRFIAPQSPPAPSP